MTGHFSTVNKKLALDNFNVREGQLTEFFLGRWQQEIPVPLTAEKLLGVISEEER